MEAATIRFVSLRWARVHSLASFCVSLAVDLAMALGANADYTRFDRSPCHHAEVTGRQGWIRPIAVVQCVACREWRCRECLVQDAQAWAAQGGYGGASATTICHMCFALEVQGILNTMLANELDSQPLMMHIRWHFDESEDASETLEHAIAMADDILCLALEENMADGVASSTGEFTLALAPVVFAVSGFTPQEVIRLVVIGALTCDSALHMAARLAVQHSINQLPPTLAAELEWGADGGGDGLEEEDEEAQDDSSTGMPNSTFDPSDDWTPNILPALEPCMPHETTPESDEDNAARRRVRRRRVAYYATSRLQSPGQRRRQDTCGGVAAGALAPLPTPAEWRRLARLFAAALQPKEGGAANEDLRVSGCMGRGWWPRTDACPR